MSITLDYASTGPVPEPVAAQIAAAARTLLTRDWWSQPLIVVQERHTKRLAGSTRIVVGSYGFIQVPADEEAVMNCREAEFIVQTLARWSQDYQMSWSLSSAGARLGDIVEGKPSPGVTGFAARICSNLKLPAASATDILKKHAYRKD